MTTAPKSAKLPVSCYIRTLNEQRLIGRVLEAIVEVVDEVVLVDCGSTDKTLELAAAAGARVVSQPWLGGGFQKRVGEEACRHDWVLDLDADEVITPELAIELRALFAAGEPAEGVYELKLVTAPPVGEPWYNIRLDFRNKLYDRRRFRMPEHKAWDQLELPPGTRVGKLKGAILHYSFRDFEHYVDKLNRVSSRRAADGKKKSVGQIRLRLIFGPAFYFFKAFIMRGLWRAGLYGLVLARLSALSRWLRDAKLYEAARKEQEKQGRS
jgi:glycosyltransferase involved in cell wall biosynthesis